MKKARERKQTKEIYLGQLFPEAISTECASYREKKNTDFFFDGISPAANICGIAKPHLIK